MWRRKRGIIVNNKKLRKMSLGAGHPSPTRIYGSRLKPYKRHLMKGVCLEIFCITCIEAHFVAKKIPAVLQDPQMG